MSKNKKIMLFVIIFSFAIILSGKKTKAAQYQWPVGGDNVGETYIDYQYYGSGSYAPIKDGKSGREYIVNNELWPEEKPYYAKSESHYGLDITGKYGHSYTVVSIVEGTVIATSANRVVNPSVNYIDRNQRRTSAGLRDGGGYGNYVVIQETSTGRCFLYAHLKGGSLKVKRNDRVTIGQEIATMGSSGDSGHMHLHFEIRTSKNATLNINKYGNHYLVNKTAYTNLDPEEYLTPVEIEPEQPVEETAQDYIPSLATPGKLCNLGDLNGDGEINASDASICLQLASCSIKPCMEYAVKYADVDNDGRISAIDAVRILIYSSRAGVGDINTKTTSLAQYYGRTDIK